MNGAVFSRAGGETRQRRDWFEARGAAELPPALRPKGVEELDVQFDGGMVPAATLEPIEVPEG